MGEVTGISWTHHTFNPWWGCTKVSPACDFCYAERDALRYGHAVWGKDVPRRFLSDAHWQEPLKWNRAAAQAGERRRVFCGSMSGLQTRDGSAELRRHRLFETTFSIPLRPRCQHGVTESLPVTGNGLDSNRERWSKRSVLSVCGHGAPRVWDREKAGRARAISICGHTPQTNTVRNRDRQTFSIEDARAAMGIDWMTMEGLSQAVPPAYSEFIAREFLAWRVARQEVT